MSLQIITPGTNYAGNGLIQVTPAVAGIPLANALAIYLCEEGANGAPHSGLLVDSSGLGHHGTLIATSTPPVKDAGGIKVSAVDASGFAFDTGVLMAGDKTILMCVKNNKTKATGAGFPVFFGQVGGITSPLSASQLSLNPYINANISIEGAAAANGGIGLYSSAPRPFATGGKRLSNAALPSEKEFITFAISFGAASKKMRFVSSVAPTSTSFLDDTETTVINELQALTSPQGNIAFGLWKTTTATVDGTLAFAAILNKESTAAEMRALLPKLQARVAGRTGVTVY